MTEKSVYKYDWTVETAEQQLKDCQFESKGGPLETNEAFVWLLEQAWKYEELNK